MKKVIILSLFISISFSTLFAQNENQIIIGSIDSLYSNILGEQRKIWVHIPQSAERSSLKNYPVLYLLDGNGHFYSVTGMIKQLSTINGNLICPEMIVVGIPNTDRRRDLTPSHTGDSINTSGGGEKFTAFLEKELIPYVDSNYPTRPYRTLIGHSLGGLLVINTLINHPTIFNNYVAIDPSLYWDDQKLLKQAAIALEQEKFEDKSLYVAIASTRNGMDTTTAQKDTTRATLSFRSRLQFCKIAAANNKNGLNFAWKYYNDENHGSIPLIAEYDALHFMFPWLKFNDWNKLYDTESNSTAQELVDLLTSHYEKVSNKFGFTVLPKEQQINNLGYRFLNNKAYDKSYAFFNLNIQNFPNSANAYDSMGDYYISQSDTIKAIEYFTRSVEIGGIPESKEKLERLNIGN